MAFLSSYSRVLLLSIHPQHVAKIYSGQKSVELRRQKPSLKKGDRIVIYATAPARSIIGWLKVDGIGESSPRMLWREVNTACGLSRQEFDKYFFGASKGYSIHISKPVLRAKPISLCELRKGVPSFHPPQGYWYLCPERTADKILLAMVGPLLAS